MTETAQHAHLILPASFPVESGGSFTNTQKVIQPFEQVFSPKVDRTGLQQLADLLNALGVKQGSECSEVLDEALSLLPQPFEDRKYHFENTEGDNPGRIYEHGCDHIVKRFDEEFKNAFENAKVNSYEGV
jgi:formate dehydrogenase major subunit